MLRLVAALHTFGLTAVSAVRTRLGSGDPEAERGSISLEQVIITLALFLVAAAVVAGITAAVNSRLAQIS